MSEGQGQRSVQTTGSPYLEVRDLRVRFRTEDGVVKAVDGVSFEVERGKTLGIVGESGSGKSVTSLAVLGLHNRHRTQVSGQILVGGRDVTKMAEAEVRKLRGYDVAMIFQDPLSSLHPFYKVGRQVAEAYLVHHPRASRKDAFDRAVQMLDRVGIPQPMRRAGQYPHEFSGGMRQRVMIAMALVNNPNLILADEPTTALDVTIQAQMLDLLRDLQRDFNTAIVLITHDLGVVSEVADDILVMYAGRVAERGTTEQVLRSPHHPYSWGLLASVPSLHGDPEADLLPIRGNPPSLINVPDGCAFHPRCRFALLDGGPCDVEVPQPLPLLLSDQPGHVVSCHLQERERIVTYAKDVASIGVAQ